jgi:uncharacterized protein YodC (DUF2158 family)
MENEMAEQRFPNGHKVKLKSGGPTMTVVNFAKYDYSEDESYKCRWFDHKNTLTEAVFTEPELESIEQNSDVGRAMPQRPAGTSWMS